MKRRDETLAAGPHARPELVDGRANGQHVNGHNAYGHDARNHPAKRIVCHRPSPATSSNREIIVAQMSAEEGPGPDTL
jgi:hypothetical protein